MLRQSNELIRVISARDRHRKGRAIYDQADSTDSENAIFLRRDKVGYTMQHCSAARGPTPASLGRMMAKIIQTPDESDCHAQPEVVFKAG